MPSLVGSTRAMLFSKSGQWLARNIRGGAGTSREEGCGITELLPRCGLHDRHWRWIALRLDDEEESCR